MQPAMTNTGKRSAPATTTGLVPFVVALFFVWGFATVLNDTLIPKLKALFALNYTEVMLTQFCFFIGYFLFSVPAGRMLERLGYMRTIVIGLCVMAAGCLMFSPAAMIGAYPAFLAALFVVAAGITILQVAANPFIAVLGPEETSHSRLNLAQAFNSLGTFVGPWVGASLLLSHQFVAPDPHSLSASALSTLRIREAQSIQLLFVTIAAVLAILALVFWGKRRAATTMGQENIAQAAPVWRVVLQHPRLALGVLSIFVYVGAEVSIGSVMTNYLMQASVLGVTAVTAGHLVSFYWGGAMVGRLIGSAVLRYVSAGRVLAVCALTAATLATVSALSSGLFAGVTVIAIGLCNSIMFPTIFTLGIEGLGGETPQGSSALCMAIVGGAIIPMLTGFTADRLGLGIALFIPVTCYLWIASFGALSRPATA